MLEWSHPFNWCDRRCERCELAGSCTLRARELARRAEHAAAGRDPDDPAVWIADVQANLTEGLELLLEDARARGLDLEELPAPSPLPLAERLERAGRELGLAAAAVGGEAQHVAMILAGKCARLGGCAFEDDDDELRSFDTVPVLLLVEALDAELAAALDRSTAAPAALARVHERHEAVRRALAPILTRVPPEARTALAALVRARRAPSPFCTV